MPSPQTPSAHTTPSPQSAVKAVDHRVRTGAARREQTRRKLLAAAMAVFAEKGVDAPSIDDFIAAAGVARGTFYNYFTTAQELLDAVSAELSDTVMASIDKVVLAIEDPLQRLSCACLLYSHLGVELPNWGEFIHRTGLRSRAVGTLADIYLPRDLAQAKAAGLVHYEDVAAARDLLFAGVSQAMMTVLSGRAPRPHLRQVMALALRGLGVTAARAQRLSQMPLPTVELPAGMFDHPPQEP